MGWKWCGYLVKCSCYLVVAPFYFIVSRQPKSKTFRLKTRDF